METRQAVGLRARELFDLPAVALTSPMEKVLTLRALLDYLCQRSQTPAIIPEPGGVLWLRLAGDRGQPPRGLQDQLWMALHLSQTSNWAAPSGTG